MPLIRPYLESRKFAAFISNGTGTGSDFAIEASFFTDDTGANITAFPATFAYYTLYLNGMPQQADVSTLTTDALTIDGGDTLSPNTPVVVEMVLN